MLFRKRKENDEVEEEASTSAALPSSTPLIRRPPSLQENLQRLLFLEIVWPMSHAANFIRRMTVPQTNALTGIKTPYYRGEESRGKTLPDVRLRALAAAFEREQRGEIRLTRPDLIHPSHVPTHDPSAARKRLGSFFAPHDFIHNWLFRENGNAFIIATNVALLFSLGVLNDM